MEALQKIAKSGRNVKALEGMPELAFGLEPIYEAWVCLSRSRGSGFNGPEPLKVVDVLMWLATAGYSRRAQLEMLWVIQAVDAAFVKRISEKRDANIRTSDRRAQSQNRSGRVPGRRG
jgi:hypothetical protein